MWVGVLIKKKSKKRSEQMLEEPVVKIVGSNHLEKWWKNDFLCSICSSEQVPEMGTGDGHRWQKGGVGLPLKFSERRMPPLNSEEEEEN